jgi:CHAD domain-containing protein
MTKKNSVSKSASSIITLDPREAKRRSCQAVLKLVDKFTSLQTSYQKNKKQEDLHQMRIVLRRLRNSLSAYHMFWSDQEFEKYKPQLAQVSRVLGPTRDLDVQIAFLDFVRNELYKRKDSSFVNTIEQRKKNERKKWNRKIEQALMKLKHRKILEHIKALLKTALDEKYFQKEIQKTLQKRLDTLLELKKYAYRPKARRKLHKIRIANKNLRYTLESYKFLAPRQIEKSTPCMIEIHHALGHVHDYDVWIEELKHMKTKKKDRKERKQFIDFCKKLRKNSYGKFIDLWESAQKEDLWDKVFLYKN